MKKPSKETRKLSFKVDTLRSLTLSTKELADVAGGRIQQDQDGNSFPNTSSWP